MGLLTHCNLKIMLEKYKKFGFINLFAKRLGYAVLKSIAGKTCSVCVLAASELQGQKTQILLRSQILLFTKHCCVFEESR